MIEEINFITNSILKPIILNGSSNNQIKGKKINNIKARGQHKSSKKHHNIKPTNVLIN